MINIITVTYNDSENLRRTLMSMRKYKSKDMRYFVIDGASSDGTEELIKQNDDIIDSYIIEKDKGLYDAMNKFRRFSIIEAEDHILWLNAGDELLQLNQDITNKILNSECAFTSVLVKFNDKENKNFLRIPKILTPQEESTLFPNSYFNHQGFFVKYKYISNLYYQSSVGLQADVLFMTQTLQRVDFNKVFVTSEPVSIFYMDGLSSTQHKKLFYSYFKVIEYLNYSKLKVILYHPYYIFTQMLRAYLPNKLVSQIIRIKKRKTYE